MFDPENDYLVPPLQAQRLVDGEYRPVEPRPDGGIECRTLGLVFHRDGERLKVVDATTGATLLRPLELHAAMVDAERAKDDAERAKDDAGRAKTTPSAPRTTPSPHARSGGRNRPTAG